MTLITERQFEFIENREIKPDGLYMMSGIVRFYKKRNFSDSNMFNIEPTVFELLDIYDDGFCRICTADGRSYGYVRLSDIKLRVMPVRIFMYLFFIPTFIVFNFIRKVFSKKEK